MAERSAENWTYRLVFIALAAAIGFAQLLPLHPGSGRIPGPDVLMALAFAWVVMRPDYVPLALLVVVFFLADILFMRPLGLWTALVVLGSEFLRSRSFMLRDMPFLYEWFLVSGVVVAVFLGNTLMLAIFAVDQPSLGLTLIGLVATILAYPLVVILGGRGVGVKKIVPGEVDRLGHKQ